MDAKHLKVALDASWERLQARESELATARREEQEARNRLLAATRAHREAHEEYRRMKTRHEVAVGVGPIH